ncbi:MAG: 16S rRNA (uracil(1498)-N(3))-methyltransferase [Lachnospiraceae bacterium]|nr:16S rRNA (uracil(1498)-N(3))-methyltransferase [Lachnospiraceae bacterium]
MYHFYTDRSNIYDDHILLDGADVNHIRNVLRMRDGEEVIICDKEGIDHYCRIDGNDGGRLKLSILKSGSNEAELATKLVLYQGIPKKDKLELIIQKAVELGAFEIVPVMTKRVIVKEGEASKEARKLERLNQIAKSAAEQSGRGIIPRVRPMIGFSEAVEESRKLDKCLIPYENADNSASGMEFTRQAIKALKGMDSAGIFIGPEGGFEEEEVKLAVDNNAVPISLGKRILRTETAGLAVLSMIMYELG